MIALAVGGCYMLAHIRVTSTVVSRLLSRVRRLRTPEVERVNGLF